MYESLLLQVQTVIRNLGLEEISDDSIVVRKFPTNREINKGGLNMPAIIISPFRAEKISPVEGTNSKDDVVYPVLVDLVHSSNENQTSNVSEWLWWREVILKKFRHQRLDGINEALTCTVEPLNVYNPAVFAKGYDHSAIVLNFRVREDRG